MYSTWYFGCVNESTSLNSLCYIAAAALNRTIHRNECCTNVEHYRRINVFLEALCVLSSFYEIILQLTGVQNIHKLSATSKLLLPATLPCERLEKTHS